MIEELISCTLKNQMILSISCIADSAKVPNAAYPSIYASEVDAGEVSSAPTSIAKRKDESAKERHATEDAYNGMEMEICLFLLCSRENIIAITIKPAKTPANVE